MVPNHPNERDDGVCPNCSAPLSGPFCSSCGQRQMDLDQPFREIAGEAMESFLSFDTRILRTLWPLVRRPGMLTVDFLAGRRARYVHPFKLYFAFCVLLFLGLAMSGYSVIQIGESEDIVTGVRVDVSEEEGVEEAAEASEEPSFLARVLTPIGDLAENDPDRLNRIFTDRLAKSIILLVPVFALLLLALYRGRRYVAHLVFSLHLHSFAFLALIVGLGIDLAAGAPAQTRPGNGLAVLVIAVYSFLALRRVYGQGRFLTIVKMQLLLLGYLVALIVTMILTLALTVVTV
ncbi:MAG: DUF3667 domain-containing protein [Acidobacteria bacterium]|uniref:DUF3667 domain-containing protein n=1 Tax=Candidatus Sulfomarinibacter kjeldsenii TaxID=2885994 RepID=A0A8J7C522_9BACT|nr:DUF3667 domain-containing protein [Candidatus Sulfomarinibacter kjeldsenii]